MILTCPQCQTRYQTDAARFGAEGRSVRCAKCGHVWHQMPEAPPDPAVAAPPLAPPPAAPEVPAPAEEATPAPQPPGPQEPTAQDAAPAGPAPEEPTPEAPVATSAEPDAAPAVEPVHVPPPASPSTIVYAAAQSTPPQRANYAYAEHTRSLDYEHDAEFLVSEPPAPPPPVRRGDPVRTAAGWVGFVALVVALSWSVMHFREAIAMLWPKTASFYAALGEPVNTRGLEIRDVKTTSGTDGGQQVLAITGRLANISGHELSVPPIRITLTDDDKRVLYNWSFSAAVATLKPGEAVNFATRLTGPPLGARHMQVQFADNKE